MKKIVVFFALALACISSLQAQDLKIGYTNSDSILLAMPETQAKLKTIESYGKQLQSQIQNMQTTLQAKVQDYQQNAPNWLPEVVANNEREIQQLQQNLMQFQQTAQQKLQQKQATEFAPLYEKIKVAIDAVAKEQGFTYIINQDPGSNFPLLYANPKHDVTPLIIEKVKGGQ